LTGPAAALSSNDNKEDIVAGYAHPEYLVETEWLARHLKDPNLRLYDCTVDMTYDKEKGYRSDNGRPKYEAGHIPGAAFIDLKDEFKDRNHHLNYMLPPPAEFIAMAGALGIGEGVRVVLYNIGPTWWATRMWWNLRHHGFDNCAVLNGGLEKWLAEGRPVEKTPRAYPSAKFVSRPRPHMFIGKEGVLKAIDEKSTVIINALAPELHSGEKVQYGRPGHIKRSVNVPARNLLSDGTYTFKSADELRRHFAKVKAMEAPKVVAYCGGGISATTDAFALALLGHDNVQLYDASMTEWGKDPTLPMETGQ
jgi:thiosulfate/3-mercaptopyruvate sulfurtransferase